MVTSKDPIQHISAQCSFVQSGCGKLNDVEA